MKRYFILSKDLGSCQNSRQAQAYEKSVLMGNEIKQTQCLLNATGAEEQVGFEYWSQLDFVYDNEASSSESDSWWT